MKSVPEILLKKNVADWTRGHVLAVRLGVGLAGVALWLLLFFFIGMLQPYLNIPHGPILGIGMIFGIVLFFLSYRVLPESHFEFKEPAAVPVTSEPSHKWQDIQEKIQDAGARVKKIFKRRKMQNP